MCVFLSPLSLSDCLSFLYQRLASEDPQVCGPNAKQALTKHCHVAVTRRREHVQLVAELIEHIVAVFQGRALHIILSGLCGRAV